MNHLIVAPIVLPALTGALLLLLASRPAWVRVLSIVSTIALFLIALSLLRTADTGVISVYALSDWVAPFGIVMVLDRLSALMVLITAVVALAAVVYAVQGWDTRGRHFHALFHFQLMGIGGAFLTGDLFNLFVFFEVLLIASYCLLLHGLGEQRLKAALHVVVINLAGSAIFLIAVSLLYSVTGTLNMAHLAERVAQVPQSDIALVRAAGLMLLGVFGIKAAVFPLYFWLPKAYASACAPVAVLFAVMTKVGVYAVLRFTTLIFNADAGSAARLTDSWLLPFALGTLALGSLGALAAQRLKELIAYFTVASVGTMLTAFALGEASGVASGLFYLIHSTFVVAAMFVVAELIAAQRGELLDRLSPGPGLSQPAVLGILFMVGAAVLAGLPLSSGFLAKIMILRSVVDPAQVIWVWAVILVTSLLAMIGLARAGSVLIWSARSVPVSDDRMRPVQLVPAVALLMCGLLMVIFAAPVKRYANDTAAQLSDQSAYLSTVMPQGVDRSPRPMRWSQKP